MVADDLGWNDVPWHNREVYAPNLDSLAKAGVILQESYVQPICTPSRSALMSGRYPFTIGRQHAVIWPEEPTGLSLNLTLLPQLMKAAGYETHAVGKWHLGFCSWAYTPTSRGFDTFYGYYTGSEDYYHHTRTCVFGEEGNKHSNGTTSTSTTTSTTPAPCNDIKCAFSLGGQKEPVIDEKKGPGYLDLRDNTEPERNQSGVYSTYVFASQVEKLLANREPEVPMFLYLPFQSVHSPLQVPEKYKKPYEHIQNHDRKTYLGMVSAMDEAVGRVIKALKDTGHYNNTVIVFTTDNGGPTITGSNNWPLRGNKTTLWEGGTRGAAFVHSPLLPNPGTTNPSLIHITDWLPTLLGLAGGDVPAGGDGVDQWGAVTEGAPAPRTHMVYNVDKTDEFSAGIRLGKYKLLVGNPGPGEWTPPPEYTKVTPGNNTEEEEKRDAGEDEQGDNELKDAVEEDEDAKEDEKEDEREGDKEMEVDAVEDNKVEEEEDEEEEEEVIVTSSDFEGGLNHLLRNMTGRNASEIRLYDLESDPRETQNVALTHPKIVSILAHLLHAHLARYTPADVPKKMPASDPDHFGGVWSPGWC